MAADKTIILIGPICSGKTSVAEIISEKLIIPLCSIDDVRFSYYEEIGYEKEVQDEIKKRDGFRGVYQYWKPFEAHTVVRVMQDYENHVIDFGGGHSVYEEEKLLEKIKGALEKFQHVFLLLPSPDDEESVKVLNQRLREFTTDQEVLDVNEHFIRHPSNKVLAKQVVYTNGKSIEDVADEIMSRYTKQM